MAFGVDVAKWITVGTIDVTQISVAAYLLLGLHQPLYAGILAALVAPQVFKHAQLHACMWWLLHYEIMKQNPQSTSKAHAKALLAHSVLFRRSTCKLRQLGLPLLFCNCNCFGEVLRFVSCVRCAQASSTLQIRNFQV